MPNISDGAFCKNGQKLKAVHYCANTLDVWEGSEYASELASRVRDVSKSIWILKVTDNLLRNRIPSDI